MDLVIIKGNAGQNVTEGEKSIRLKQPGSGLKKTMALLSAN